jgi:hypothetical protein
MSWHENPSTMSWHSTFFLGYSARSSWTEEHPPLALLCITVDEDFYSQTMEALFLALKYFPDNLIHRHFVNENVIHR